MSIIYKSINTTFNVSKQSFRTWNNFISKQYITTDAASPSTSPRSILKLGALGAAIGLFAGTGYSIYKLNTPRGHILNEETTIPIIGNAPDIAPSRRIRFNGDNSGLKLTLYQYQTCPFCCKVRAFLDYYGISYDIVEVDPVLRQSIKWSTYKKVPILLAKVEEGYQPLNDSSMIVSAISSHMQGARGDLSDVVKYYPLIKFSDEGGSVKTEVMNRYFLMLEQKELKNKSIEEINEERKWRKWVDEVLVHTLSPNVYRTPEEAIQAFNWFSNAGNWEEHFPTWERYTMIYIGAFAMWLIGKRLKTRHHLKDDVRQSLYDECNNFVKAVRRKGSPFMGGKEPNLADLAMYGVLSSIEGCNAFQDALIYSNIKVWYFAMKEVVQNHQGSAFA